MKKEKLFFGFSCMLSTLFFLWFFALSLHLIAQSIRDGLFFVLLSAVAFFLVSALRRIVRAKRPYQHTPNMEIRHGKDDSFPSRHAYSCFFITTVTFFFFPIVCIPLFILSALLCLFRVLSGAHYTIDVIAGALIGLAFGCMINLFI